jgi:hypothetical protein
MNTLEQEIIEKFRQLDQEAKQRIRALLIEQKADVAVFDFDAWTAEVETIRQQIHVAHGEQFPEISVVDILRDIRDGEDE